jgi:menaquinone-dependent protoporphyrinogen oxidase
MKILVAYASGFGATAEVAKEMADILGRRHLVDLQPIGRVRSLDRYEAVVVGSSLRAGRWLGAMRRFVGHFHQALAERPLAIFVVALTARTHEGSRRVLAEALPKLLERYPEVKPVATEAFGGVLDYDRYNPLVRAIMRKAALQEGLPTAGLQDFRDWEAIRKWAAELGEKLAEGEKRESERRG